MRACCGVKGLSGLNSKKRIEYLYSLWRVAVNKIKPLLIILLLPILVGCATRAQQQSSNLQKAYQDAVDKFDACQSVKNLNSDVQYVYKNILIDRIQNPQSSNKYELLSSNKKMTKEDRQKFIVFLDENTKCRVIGVEGLSKVHPSLVTAVINSHRRVDVIYGKFLAGEINIGELNRELEQNSAQHQKEWDVAISNINSALANDHNYEMQSRQQAAAAIQNWSLQQQQINQNQMMLNNLNRPRTTNCNMIGNSVNCTSY